MSRFIGVHPANLRDSDAGANSIQRKRS